MQVNSAQDYLTAQKRRIVAKMAVDSPQPATRRYNYVYTSVLANGQSQYEKITYPQNLSLAAGSTPGLSYVAQGLRPTFSWCCDPYFNSTLAAAAAPLYSFTSFTFTPANATGRDGPTLSAAVSAYSGTASWATNTSFFNMTTQGYQLWTVPETRSYTVRCAGAAAGTFATTYGLGAIIQTTLSLTKGQVLQLLVGQMGLRSTADSGGGGGSFVASGLTPATGVCLVAAGGGGGNSGSAGNFLNNATNSTTGNNSTGGALGGSGGLGGACSAGNEAAGGGFTGNGANGGGTPTGGLSFVNGGRGGSTAVGGFGGFGGGGGTHGGGGLGGGGGGYSGGAAGGGAQGAGGGGSFPSGATFIGATNAGQGYITITAL